MVAAEQQVGVAQVSAVDPSVALGVLTNGAQDPECGVYM